MDDNAHLWRDGTGFWRVWLDEWSVVYVSDTDGEPAERECQDRFSESYEDKVQVGGWRIVPWSTDEPGGWPWMLEVRLPVMKGEYRDEAAATDHASRIGGIVAREGSQMDRKIQRYEKDLTRRRGSG